VAAYLAGYVALAANSSGVAANVLTVFRLTAPLVLPARSALVGVPLWEHALAVALVLASIYALVRFAGRVYAHGLLHAGPRLGPREAWRLTHQH
jgi:ABC-2 type transport system permease protein